MAEGPLVGGCLETICWHLKGSAFWPNFAGTILFLETSEEAPSPSHVDAYLTDLEQLGVFESSAGLVVGRPMGYTDDEREAPWRVIQDRTARAVPDRSGVIRLGSGNWADWLAIGLRT